MVEGPRAGLRAGVLGCLWAVAAAVTAAPDPAAVALAWKPYFDGPAAPFSWLPDRVEVLADGTLALSTGPVSDPTGKAIARFNSIWRLEAPGTWRVVFDKGQPADK